MPLSWLYGAFVTSHNGTLCKVRPRTLHNVYYAMLQTKIPRKQNVCGRGPPCRGGTRFFCDSGIWGLASFVVTVASNSMLKNNVHYSNICCQSDKRGSCGVQPLKPQSAPGKMFLHTIFQVLFCSLLLLLTL